MYIVCTSKKDHPLYTHRAEEPFDGLIRLCPPTQTREEGILLLPSIMALTLSEIVVESKDLKVDSAAADVRLVGKYI